VLLASAVLCAQSWGTRSPRVVTRSEPEYTEEARRAGVNSTVTLSLVVNEDGAAEDIRVVRGAGFGLDESAVHAIKSWRFEPASREGKPFKASTHVEVHFKVSHKAHADQTARLRFSAEPGVERPELIQGSVPANPDPPVEALLRVRFTVNPDGRLTDLQTLESNNKKWTDGALREIAGWRFRPAMRNGQAEEIRGIFEMTVSPPSEPDNRPRLQREMVAISAPEPQDYSLPAPQLISPRDGGLFDGYPRRVRCKWEASPGAVSYLLEWDYMDRDAWNAEYQGIPGTAMIAAGVEETVHFIGAQPGRWRVWPVNASGQRGNPSEWRTFRFLH
jgi:TonB family protein